MQINIFYMYPGLKCALYHCLAFVVFYDYARMLQIQEDHVLLCLRPLKKKAREIWFTFDCLCFGLKMSSKPRAIRIKFQVSMVEILGR